MTRFRILVTGGAGFLGKYVVSRLMQAGHEVIVADNLDPLCGGSEQLAAKCDVRDLQTVAIWTQGITHIIHLAAYGRNLTCQDHPVDAWNVNVTGTLNVLECARRTGARAVICSSNIVLSDKITVYRETKRAVERLIDVYASFGVSCVGLRPSNIYGKGQSKTEYQLCAFAGLDKSFAETGKFKITGDGTQARDWVHAEDVARAFELALTSDVRGVTLDICTGRLTSMNRVAELLDVPVEYVEARPGDAKELVSDWKPAAREIYFNAQANLKDRIWDAFPAVKVAKEIEVSRPA